jgi:hypothetical protein
MPRSSNSESAWVVTADHEFSFDRIEKIVDVGVQQPRVALGVQGVDALDGHAHGTAAAVGEAAGFELALQIRFEIGGHRGLQHAVAHGRHQQAAPLFRAGMLLHLHPPQRPSPVGFRLYQASKAGQFLLQPVGEVTQTLPVAAGATVILAYPGEGMVQRRKLKKDMIHVCLDRTLGSLPVSIASESAKGRRT